MSCSPKRLAWAQRYRDANRDKVRTAVAAWQNKNPEHQALYNAKRRCTDEANPTFKSYGARGIEYLIPGATTREQTENLIEAIGRRPEGMTLDRIDNDGHYELSNLRWATPTTQSRNQRKRSTNVK